MSRKFRKTALLFVIIVWGSSSYLFAKAQDTLRLFYSVGGFQLSKSKMTQLRLVVDSANHGYPIQINGFADELGTQDFNARLSVKRAIEIKKYLLYLVTGLEIITEGKGQILSKRPAGNEGDSTNRRVDIIFKKKNRDDLSNIDSKLATSTVNKQHTPAGKFLVKIDSLSTIQIGKSIDFNELIFDPGSHHLTPESMTLLKDLTKFLANNKNIIFEIRGHICCDYDHPDGLDFDTKTLNLSVNRAKEIYEYFLSNGISRQRMTYKGVGGTQPKVYPERNDNDQWANRRVEIIVTSR